MQLLHRHSIVHAPELEGAPSSALELDDHIQLLPVLRAEIVLRDFPATRDLALDHEIAALPVALDLDVPASVHYLGDLAAVVVEYQRRAAVRPERKARISLDDHECGGCIEHQLHRLAHPLALLVAHPSPAPLTAAPPTLGRIIATRSPPRSPSNSSLRALWEVHPVYSVTRWASRLLLERLLSPRRDVPRNALYHPGGPTRRAGRHGNDPGPARRGRSRGGPRLRSSPHQPHARSLRGPRRGFARRAPAGGADSRRPLLRRRYAGARFLTGLTPSAFTAAAASITPYPKS